MNTYQAFEKFLTFAAVVGGVACTAFVLCWTLRRELRAALDRWLALGPAGRCATALFASVCVIYGSTKAPTNSPPNGIGGGAPQMNAPLAGLHLPLPALMSPPPLSAALATNEQWLARGAWNDWKRIDFPDGFAFPLGTNLLYSVTLMSQGSLRDSLANPSPFAALPAALSLEPEASTVAYGPTPSNSFVFAWSNACIDREPTNRVDASIELFASGDMEIRFGDTCSFVPAQPPEGFVGIGQDAAWTTNAFPDYADAIATNGYSAWLENEYVGINEQNGRFMASVTVSSLPEVGPCYLVCGPYSVVVDAPGTYSFPLEVFETYTVRTYPTALPLSISTDDGYRDASPSMSPPMFAAPPSPPPASTNIYEIHEVPRLVISPNHVPLNQAVGTHVSIWCNMTNAVRRFVATAANEFYLTFCNPTEAEIIQAEVETAVEIILENPAGTCSGFLYIDPQWAPEGEPVHNCCTNCCGYGCLCNGMCCACSCNCYSGSNNSTTNNASSGSQP